MFAAGAESSRFPAVKEEPRAGRIGSVLTDDAEGIVANLANLGMEIGNCFLIEESSVGSWGKACSPKNFVGHPVADAGEELLHEQEGLEWGTRAAGADTFAFFLTDFRGVSGGRVGGPPRRRLRGKGEADPAEEARILKDE
jgi:hypothetical protein